MATEFFDAGDVRDIAVDVIEDTHVHLKAAPIEYVFITPSAVSKGREIWGRVKRISGLPAWLAADKTLRGSEPDPFFVVEISMDIWKMLGPDEQKALVDHELSHIVWDGEKGDFTLTGHDIEEFTGVVSRHGLWNADVKRLVEAAREKENVPLLADQIETFGVQA